MKKQLLLIYIACLACALLSSCHTTQKYSVAAKSSKQPKFISDIYISGHSKTSTTVNAIEPKKPVAKLKSTYVAPAPKPEPKPVAEVYYASNTTDKGTLSTREFNPYPINNDPISVTDAAELKRKYADLLGVKGKEINNYPLYNFIDRWYGTNYRLGGCDKSGIDCSGFAQKLYGEVYGIDLLRTAMEQFANCKRIKKSEDAEEGDLVFFKVHSKHITHVGVFLANNYFIHASTSGGVMISSLNEEYWRKHYAGCGRIPRSN